MGLRLHRALRHTVRHVRDVFAVGMLSVVLLVMMPHLRGRDRGIGRRHLRLGGLRHEPGDR